VPIPVDGESISEVAELPIRRLRAKDCGTRSTVLYRSFVPVKVFSVTSAVIVSISAKQIVHLNLAGADWSVRSLDSVSLRCLSSCLLFNPVLLIGTDRLRRVRGLLCARVTFSFPLHEIGNSGGACEF
jgi:hypothetical protein